jgi:hypothetical protein
MLIVLIGFAMIDNFSIQAMLTQVMAPFLPMFTLTFKLRHDHGKSIKNLTELKQNLDKLAAAEQEGKTPSMDTLRQVQDRIFINRKDSPLIPEQFYDWLRNRLEQEMHDNASSMV